MPTASASPAAVSSSGTRRASRRWLAAAAAIVVLLALSAGALWMTTHRSESPTSPLVASQSTAAPPAAQASAPAVQPSAPAERVAAAPPSAATADRASDRPAAQRPADRAAGHRSEPVQVITTQVPQQQASQPAPQPPVTQTVASPAAPPAASAPAAATQPPPSVPAAVAVTAPVGASLPASTPPAPAPAAPAEALPSPTERVNELLRLYKQALEGKSLDQLKQIWPSLGGAPEAAMRQEFQHASSIAVEISDPQVTISGSTGRVRFVRGYSLLTVDGQQLRNSTQAVMDVRRSGDAWTIDAIRFLPR
jgi:hypothetical protein